MSPLIHVRAFALAAATAVVATSSSATPPAAPPDPASPGASVPPLTYHPVLAGYRALPGDRATSWRQANEQAAAIGGWRAYAREAQRPEGAPSDAVAAPAGRGAP